MESPQTAQDPTDIRGSMSRFAKTGFEPTISWRATQARAGTAHPRLLFQPSTPADCQLSLYSAAVSRGPITASSTSTAPNTRRPLGFSRTEPNLSFGSSSSSSNPPTMFPPFRTAQDVINLVYTDGKRADELQPFGAGGSNASGSRSNSQVGSGLFGSDAMGGGGGATETSMDDDGDGFDLDEVYGAPSSSSFNFPSSSQGQAGDSQDSARTVTQRMKRAYEDPGAATVLLGEGEGGGDDEEMVPTDVEDEGEDEAADLPKKSMFGQGRKIAGAKRTFGRTQSLPSSAFSGQMEF